MSNPVANIDFARINEILGSKGFQNASGLAGAFLTSKGQADRADKQSAQNVAVQKAQLGQNANQFAATLAARLAESKRAEGLNRAVSSANATKLGENENFATRNRILSTIIPNLRNSAMRPTDPAVAAAMGPQQGFLPEGGLPPELLAAISERGTANAIADRTKQRMNIDPNTPAPDFGAMGFGDGTDTFDLGGYSKGIMEREAGEQLSTDQIIERALQQDYEGINAIPDQQPEEKKQGFLGKLGSILKFAAPIAAMAIPGLGPIASMALAGGGSAAGGLMQGDNIGQALMGGAMGAAGAYGGKNLPKKKPGMTNPFTGPYSG